MARIFPNRPAQSVLDDHKRSGEVKLFLALKSLPDTYTVFYSTHWQDQSRYAGVQEGEADFVIAHPEKGFIFLEVKGGGIRYANENDQWYSQDRNNDYHKIKDPVAQARRNHYNIETKLKEIPGWPQRKINMWHAVCFPDVWIRPGQSIKLDLPREQVLDFHDLKNIEEAVANMFTYSFGMNMKDYAPGTKALQLAEKLLANSFEFKTPLGAELESVDQKLVQLTEKQFQALQLLGNRKRVAISGCAGSGKTMLAMKKAQQFRDLGLNVLFVCFNSALAEFLKTKLTDATVENFHALCALAARRLRKFIPKNIDDQKKFTELYPDYLMEFAGETDPIYDAIIVDEGQDFLENYWIALHALLKQDGYFFIFYDDNQNIFQGSTDFGGLITEPPFQLFENCRNTKLIHETVKQYHNNPNNLISSAPDGIAPEWITYSNADEMKRELSKVLHKLVKDENVSSEDIVVLTPKGDARTALPPGTQIGIFKLIQQSSSRQTDIMVSSIQRFKGLEKRVVIISELDPVNYKDLETLLYVGCSRARTHLIVLHNASVSIRTHSCESLTRSRKERTELVRSEAKQSKQDLAKPGETTIIT